MHELTLLWALRSPCDLGCRYCYFGTIEEHRQAMPDRPGELSHLSRADVSLADITAFLTTVRDSAIKRVFVAGGEPLIWPHTLTVVEILAQAGVEVIVCTNGIPLNRPEITQRLLDAGVAAVSVSLDSADPAENDEFRPARNKRDGWHTVVSGIRALLAQRGAASTPKVGLYTVITRRTLTRLPVTAAFAAELGADYFVPQPISLDDGHALHDQLALRPEDEASLSTAFNDLYAAGLPIALPAPTYPAQVASSIRTATTAPVQACFGGHTLAFIQPDGSVWDCPSRYKIAATAPGRRRTIRGASAADLFPATRTSCASDCALFSRDCVSMWPLMDFQRFLARPTAGHAA
jgi:MoaA/NifB/PqqE/SkfB family radical SAM enzyme